MSSDIVLGAATRQNLLALQNINTQINTSEGHLATGLKVASAVDNAVSFFQAQSLNNRASDILQRKDTIDQSISSLTVATQAAQSVVSILQQLQGVVNAAKTQTGAQLQSAAQQFNTLGAQLNNLVNDASFQGLNLVNSTTSKLTVQFSLTTSSTLTVQGFNLQVSAFAGLGQTNGGAIGSHFSRILLSGGNLISTGSGLSSFAANKTLKIVNVKAASATANSKGSGVSKGSGFSVNAALVTITEGSTVTHKVTKFSAGSGLSVGSTLGISTTGFSAKAAGHGYTAASGANFREQINATGLSARLLNSAGASSGSQVSKGSGYSLGGQKATGNAGFTAASNQQLAGVFNVLQNAITSVQGDAQSLGANVTLLQTRLSFSADYATTLNGGADKLTLADVNKESTNLVTLQTRQSLSIQSLSIATQSEQAVLRLFH